MKWAICGAGTLVLLIVACGVRSPESESIEGEPCRGMNAPEVCVMPFEAIYSHPGTLPGKLIAVDGVVIAGSVAEPPGRKEDVILLFPSFERARVCNWELAIKLLPKSAELGEKLKSLNGHMVRVTGALHSSAWDYWAELEVSAGVSAIGWREEGIACMGAAGEQPVIPPPPLKPVGGK